MSPLPPHSPISPFTPPLSTLNRFTSLSTIVSCRVSPQTVELWAEWADLPVDKCPPVSDAIFSTLRCQNINLVETCLALHRLATSQSRFNPLLCFKPYLNTSFASPVSLSGKRRCSRAAESASDARKMEEKKKENKNHKKSEGKKGHKEAKEFGSLITRKNPASPRWTRHVRTPPDAVRVAAYGLFGGSFSVRPRHWVE